MQAVTAKKKTFKNPFSENAQNVSKTEPVQESSKESVEAADDDKKERVDDDKCKKNVDQTVSEGAGEPCVNKSSDEVKQKEVNGNVSQSLKKEKKAVPSFQAPKKDKLQKNSKEDNVMQGEKLEKKKLKKEKNENNISKQEKVIEKTKKPKVPKRTKSEELPSLTREDYEEIFKAVIGPSYTSLGYQVGGNGDKTENKKEEEKQICDKEDTESEGKIKITEIECENDEEMTEDKSITTENKEEEGKDQKMTHIDSDSENTEEVAEKTATKNDCDDEKTTENKERIDINKENSHTGIDVEIKKKKKKKAKVLGENENNETVKIKEKKGKKVTKTCDDNEITNNEEKVKKKKKVKKTNADETIKIKKKKKDQSITNVECNTAIEKEEGEEIPKAAEVQECSNEDIEHENDEEMVHCSRSNVDNGDQNPSGSDSFNEIQQINEVTPEGSEVDDECLTQRVNETPPPKKKPKIKSVPKKVIKPKKLHFEKSDLDKVKNGSNNKKDNKNMEQVQDVKVKRKKSLDRKRMFINREYTNCGTWVQCCECEKWRLLLKIDDPTELPDRWLCKMNTDESFNSCDTAEQSYDESDHIFTKYSEGSVVWARIAGYPWWPAMIELDPDTESFYEVVQAKSQYPTHYHVVFFDEKVTRSWVKSSSLMQFVGKENLDFSLKGGKHASFKKDINTAKENALNALKLPVKERIKQYSFGVRFKGKWCKSVEENLSEDDDHMKEKKKQKSGKKRKNLEKHRATTDKMIDVLDNTTVDDILQNPDDVLKGFEEVLESIDSDDELSEVDLTDVKKGKFDFESDESESDEDMNKKLKLKQHKKEKQEKKTKSKKKEKEPKPKSEKVKKRKLMCDDDEVKQSHTNKTIERDNKPSNESECDSQKDDEIKLPVVESSGEDTCELQIETTSEGKTGMKFDSEIFTMDMDSSEKLQSDCDKAPEKCKNAKKSGQKKNKGFSVPPKSKDQPKNDECLESNTGIKPVTETLELNLEEHLEVENESENISDVKPTEQDLEFKFEEDYVDDKMIDPNEQTVPSLDNDMNEEDNDELSLDIPVNDISKHSTENVEINTNVAVLVTDYDTEGSDPFDMEE